jgi:hypothetical protein
VTAGSGVSSVEWHPIDQNLLALTTLEGKGVFISVSLDSCSASILSELVSNSPLTSVSWSPKGKQCVFSKTNGSLSFYKHNNGKDLTEARIISTPEEVKGLVCNSVKWVYSSVLLVTYKGDCTRYCVVLCPVKQTPQVIDFGSICFDNKDYTEKYFNAFIAVKTGLVISCSSHSSEVGVIGHKRQDDHHWNHFNLDDDKRIELPLAADQEETFPRGLDFIEKTWKEMNSFGGKETPCLFILTSDSIICSYYVVSEKDSVEGVIVPKAIALTSQEGKGLEEKPQTTQHQVPKTTQDESFESSILSSLSFCPPSHSTPSRSAVNPFGPTASQTPLTQSSSKTSSLIKASSFPQPAFGAASQTPVLQGLLSKDTGVTSQGTSTVKPVVDKTSPIKEVDVALEIAKEEMESMTRLIQEQKKRVFARKDKITQEVNQISNTFSASKEIVRKTDLQQQALESSIKELEVDTQSLFGWFLRDNSSLLDAKSRLDKLDKTKSMRSQCPLDPLTQRKMQGIIETNQKIEEQLGTASHFLQSKWESSLESTKDSQLDLSQRLPLLKTTIDTQRAVLQALSDKVSELEDRAGLRSRHNRSIGS